MAKYELSSSVTHKFPRSPTLAADALIGIMNRNSTPKVIGDRILGGNHSYALPISNDVMSLIMGRDIGHNWVDSCHNAAIATYMDKVKTRLATVGFTLYAGDGCWVCLRSEKSTNLGIAPGCIYNTDDYADRPGSNIE